MKQGSIKYLNFFDKLNTVSNLEVMRSSLISDMSDNMVIAYTLIDKIMANNVATPFKSFWIYPSPCVVVLPRTSKIGEGFMKPLALYTGMQGGPDQMMCIAYTFDIEPKLVISFVDPEDFYDYTWFMADDEWIDEKIRTSVNKQEIYWCLVAYGKTGGRYYTGYYDQGVPKASRSFDKALKLSSAEDAEELKKHLPKPFFDATPWSVEEHMYSTF